MIRVTQTHLIKHTIRLYQSNGWETVYFDLPGGQRSGIGRRAQINSIWEKLYNLSPDIAFIKLGEVRLFEVDYVLNADYIEKFSKYKRKERALMQQLSAFLGVINLLTFGFVARINRFPEVINNSICPLYFYFFTDENLCETIIKPSRK
jgi:hypothetical protein